jgi:hypothetical protein
MGRKRLISVLDGILLVVCCAAVSYAQNQPTEIIPVEVFHVGQLPVAITNVELVGSAKGFQLRCSMTNNSDEKLLGFRYSIVAIDSNNAKTAVANRSEAWSAATDLRQKPGPRGFNVGTDCRRRVDLGSY